MATILTKRNQYVITKSPFFRLHSRQTLAELLGITLLEMETLASRPSNALYRMYDDSASKRHITAPLPELQRIHKRIARLFSRIIPPAYLQSATKKRSYKTNAAIHRDGPKIAKVDIRQYYPSITFGAIFSFFKNRMQCSPDVSTVLTKLCTVSTKGRTHLPTGSSLSPILSYWVHSELFDRIKSICDDLGCRMSLYVDDITISGKNADAALVTKIEREIEKTGLTAHKIKIFDGIPATVTGVVVHKGRLALPHDRAKDIRMLREALDKLPEKDADSTLSKLIGKLNEAEQFVAGYGAIKKTLLSDHAPVWTRITTVRVEKSKAAARRKRLKAIGTRGSKTS
ncbi:reverse transcriptase family protein [Burkholderia pseudomallei]|uniref:reverse transcriptase family protein n=1 Tax=Burkholderia pseudomallei TaxID=28450 RepID=UPI0005380C49|nr:reverse transcriptase family protein [Burkholderia pseudomallei]APY91879.1 reverse transcriptase [Burkholderia pseudomallei]KGV62231.1 reverse transcriptase family protein [Burkholderia pseudomallei ABCPW 91]OMO14159.1 reverse transcriptase [Burkholderia pseudomallei]